MSDRLIFINLPVADVKKTRAFFTALGFTFNDQFADEQTICMRVNDQAYFMLMERPKFAGFAPHEQIGDPRAANAHLLAFSAESRDAVDTVIEAVIAAGGEPVGQDEDYGYMYGRGFYDLDGHPWSVMWMDPAVAAGEEPAEPVATDA